MSRPSRRIFWGHSLAQALAKAARYHSLPVERLAYRLYERRHGFVRVRRAVLIEIDPEHPARPQAEATLPAPVAAERHAARPAPRPPAPRGEAAPERTPPRPAAGRPIPSWDEPDEESVYGATEAMRRMLELAGLDLATRVEISEGRLELALEGPDDERLRGLGVEFLDALEGLLPRAILGLSGRRVRCRIDGAGLRDARAEELRARARAIAERVRETGVSEMLEPLSSAERRIVHLELRDAPGVGTESVGDGFMKRVRIAPA